MFQKTGLHPGAAQDVEEIRKHLGYVEISLFGKSFGSQLSLAFLKLYPNRVARAVLTAVEPLDATYDKPAEVFAALQRIAFDADQDPELKPYLPPGGMMAAIESIRRRLSQHTQHVRVFDPASESHISVILGPQDFEIALMSHLDEPREWPAFILEIFHNHYERWAKEAILFRQPQLSAMTQKIRHINALFSLHNKIKI